MDSASKGSVICTAAILDFFRHVIITIKVLNYFRKVSRKVTTLNVLEVSFSLNSLLSYYSFSRNVIGDDSAFFLCTLGVHLRPTNAFESLNFQNYKNTFL